MNNVNAPLIHSDVTQEELWDLTVKLFPICRSLTGKGVRQTLDLIKELIPIEIHEIPSGTKVFDWTIPPEWNINEAWIKDEKGNTLVDFQWNNLHLVGYSIPFDGILTLKELEPHLYSLPEQQEAIPYVTSYYNPWWGFCMKHSEKQKLRSDTNYHVHISSSLTEGSLTYADLLIKGKSEKEILISTYVCHPSMANNELSGPVVATFLAKELLQKKDLEYTYRFVFIPETIGSIAYLKLHGETLKKNVIAGYVLTCIGDPKPFSYLMSREGDALVDRLTMHLLKATGEPFLLYSFLERGSDERQYCSPGMDLPVGSLMRSKYGTYPQYHTSLDNLSFITKEALYASFKQILRCLHALEHNHYYLATNPCEPQLGKRGLYPTLSTKNSADSTRLMMNFLAYADGKRDLLSIAEKIGSSIETLIPMASLLCSHQLVEKIEVPL